MTNEEMLKKLFFNSYKCFMDYLMAISNKPNEYKILVTTRKKDEFNEKLNVFIIKEDYSYKRDNSTVYSNTIVMSKQNIEDLTNIITEDFVNNHFVNYACINEEDMTQTIQNSRFRLVFKLNNSADLFNAQVTNRKINLEKEKTNTGKVRELVR